MTPREILIAAKAKIATRETWCTNAIALNATGAECSVNSPLARKWCALGAFWAVAQTDNEETLQARNALHRVKNGRNFIVDVNDCDGFDAVHELYDRAIASLE